MNISNKTIWQQAAGDTDLDYSELCLRWDVILNGPGSAGSWLENKLTPQDSNLSSRKITDLKRFAEEMSDGDFVVLEKRMESNLYC